MFTKISFLLITLIVLSLIGCSKQSDKNNPNFVFIILDDMKQEEFNFLPRGKGKNLTPNIDKLAMDGTIFLNQYVASPVCTPSRYNCLTGRFAGRAGNQSFKNSIKKNRQNVVQWNTSIIPSDITVAEVLRDAGYKTGFVGKNHVIEVKNWQQLAYDSDLSSEENRLILEKNDRKVRQAIQNSGFDYTASIYHRNPEAIGAKELSVHNMDWIAQGAVDFIDTLDEENPFFLYFAATLTHGPNEAERSWNANPLATPNGMLKNKLAVMPDRSTIPERLKNAGLENQNKENLLWLDDAIGAVINKLEEKGLDDNTYIFFFNDHGQDAKGTIYQGGILNPSIIWKKGGLKSGNESLVKISNIDFAPTILDLADVYYKPAMFDGKSFGHVLNGSTEPVHDELYFEMGYTRAIIKGEYKYLALRYPEYAEKWSYDKRKDILDAFNKRRAKRNQIIVNPNDPMKPFSHIMLLPGGGAAEFESTGKLPGYYDSDQLYNIKNDHEELTNLADDPNHKDKLLELKSIMSEYINTFPGGFPLDSNN
ncbi:MAG: sulfatase-like hydrolase/transferase [Melioribacteraceae bacterium]|nr:sulfatase-like hydrolase/transferase [Melioribacteraceae bacterium]